jgi:hypothetical protein
MPTALGGTSGTYSYAPSVGELVLYSYGLCGVRRTAILQEHMADASIAANLLLGDWSLKGVNLWQVDKITIPLLEGQATYDLDPDIVVMLDTYITHGPPWALLDRIILPVGRTEYASYPNKVQEGFPTVFWMDRQLAPTVSIWPVPPDDTYDLTAYVLRQAQDANLDNAQIPAIPVVWLNAFAVGLAAKLAMSWAPDRLAMLGPAADAAYAAAAANNVETAQQYIAPQLQGYFR